MGCKVVWTCDHCKRESDPVEQGDEDTAVSMSYGPKTPSGWAEVTVSVDMPRAKSEHSKLAEEQIAAAQKVVARMPKSAPERELVEIGIRQMQAGSEMFAGMGMAPPKTRTSMILCTRCQEGPVFEVVQKRAEESSGLEGSFTSSFGLPFG